MMVLSILGRLHPVILHLPIGVLFFVYFLELLGRFKKTDTFNQSISIGLGLGSITAVVSCITGYLLYADGDYQGNLIEQHKWLGFAVAFLSLVTLWLQWNHRKIYNGRLYFPVFTTVILLLVIGGHKGGSITHGSDFLRASEEKAIVYTNVNEAVAFADIILPILNKKCNSCHNPSKAKGELVMTTQQGIMNGGENGPILIAGNVTESALINNILLPVEDDDHMPPKSKPQLTESEITLLQWWVKSGASFEASVGELSPEGEVKEILDTYQVKNSSDYASSIDPVDQSVLNNLMSKESVAITSVENSPFIDIDLSNRNDLDERTFRHLLKVRKHARSINLGHSNVSDNMMKRLKKFPNLTNIQLQNTKITRQGLSSLTGLPSLSVLNLYGTSIGNEIEEIILSLPSLQSLYLWNTKVTSEMVNRLRNERPFLTINIDQQTDIFKTAALKPPLIVADKDFFSDSLEVSLVLNFKDVNIYYTIDGSDPDSLSSMYEGPFTIDKTTLVQASSYKEKWKRSDIASRQFVRAKYEIQDLALSTSPAKKYKGSGTKTLTDFKKGSLQFTDGMWLGFEGKNVTATIDLGKPVTVSGATISALEATGSWIFFPKGIKIWSSIDGASFDLQNETDIAIASAVNPPASKNFSQSFPPVTSRYLKIEIESVLKNPEWHPAPGGSSWVFIDEIMIE